MDIEGGGKEREVEGGVGLEGKAEEVRVKGEEKGGMNGAENENGF